MKKISIIAGPNGAGKTTSAMALIPEIVAVNEYINADEIAKGLSPIQPQSVALLASKLMIKRLKGLLSDNKSFAFETTAAGLNYIKHLKVAKENGYEINFTYLWLDQPETAVMRVATRVAQGGHNIPENVIRRRYFTGAANALKHYLPLADKALILDNSVSPAKVIARKNNDIFEIVHKKNWEILEELAKKWQKKS